MYLEEKMLEWFKGDKRAVNFVMSVWDAAQVWDDVHDEGDLRRLSSLFSWLAFDKEYDPFFIAHSVILRPAMLQMYLSWQAANELEKGDQNDISKAYMLRAGFYQVVHMVTWATGGHDWAVKIGPEIFREYGETLKGFIAELKKDGCDA